MGKQARLRVLKIAILPCELKMREIEQKCELGFLRLLGIVGIVFFRHEFSCNFENG